MVYGLRFLGFSAGPCQGTIRLASVSCKIADDLTEISRKDPEILRGKAKNWLFSKNEQIRLPALPLCKIGIQDAGSETWGGLFLEGGRRGAHSNEQKHYKIQLK